MAWGGNGLATAAAATPMSGDGPDAEGVRQYRLALAREARRYKRYPPEAMDRGLGGVVEVGVSVAGGNMPHGVQLVRSSGNPQLDEAALDMVHKAASLAVVPELLRGRGFTLVLPVVFEAARD